MKKKENNSGSRLKVIPLGGLEQIGMNITAFEYGDSIVVVDCGLSFPADDMLGIDLVIPDVTYLKENIDKVKGFVITHGHEDHIGALPYVLRELNVPVYATRLTMGIIENKLKEHELTKNTKPVLRYSLLAAGVKIVATVALIRPMGIQGAALGSLIAFFFYFLMVVWGLRHSVRLRPDGKSCFRILASAFLCALSAWLVCRWLPAGPFLQTVCGAGAGGAVYFACLLVSGELKPEIEMVRQAIAARRGGASKK